MIKTYMPNGLISAGRTIAKQHPLNGIGSRKLTEKQLKALLEMIYKTSKERLPSLAETLTSHEINALCDYLPKISRITKSSYKLILVLKQIMKPFIFSRLIEMWQNYPNSRSLLLLLALTDTADNRVENSKISVGQFKKWFKIGEESANYYFDLIRYVFKMSKGSSSLQNAFEEVGLKNKTPLYMCCVVEYLSYCEMPVFVNEGDVMVNNCMRNAPSTQARTAIIYNLLKRGSNQKRQLMSFHNCYRTIYRMFGIPDRDDFGKEHLEAYYTYRWWYNYKSIEEGFNHDADKRRIDFWMHYLDRCEISRLKPQQFIIMIFGQYCVVESEIMGTLYFFETDYFNKHVLFQLKHYNAAGGKSWMKNNSRYVYKKTHAGRWEAEVPYKMSQLGMI